MTLLLARFRKRCRVVLAALTQEWHEHRCSNAPCTETWWCMGEHCRQLWPEDECPACLDRSIEQVVLRDRRRIFA